MKHFQDYQGLAAEVYDAIWTEEYDDIPFLVWLLGPPSGRLLELGCGTGRVMVPLLREGWRCHGIDASADMLKICRKKLEDEGLSAELHQQRMEKLQVAGKYRRIIIPGFTFQHILDTKSALKVLRRIGGLLGPGGRLILSLFHPWSTLNDGDGSAWRPRSSAGLEDGRQVICHESFSADPVLQLMTVWNRYEVVDGSGRIIDQTLVRNRIRWYGLDEFRLLLEAAGFDRVMVYGDFTPDPPGSDTTFLTFEGRCLRK